MQTIITRISRAAALVFVTAGLAACGVDGQEAPSLIGPSGFAQSVVLSASPDRLPRDGSSQSVITITVRNESGQPVAGQRVIVNTNAGTLSQSEVVTTSDGRATLTVTAPASGSTGDIIVIDATPVGGNFDSAVTRSLSIALTGTSNSAAPIPSFTFAPVSPEVGQVVTFDASATTDEGVACSTTCTFAWDFGDGATAAGAIVTHAFAAKGDFTVKLTVTDPAGTTASSQQVLSSVTVAAPTVSLTVEPDPPVAGRPAAFAATANAASGHKISQYAWDFGDGTTLVTTSPESTHVYKTQGVFVAKIVVTDDVGQTASFSLSFNILQSAVSATITFSPTDPIVGQRILFHALNPTAPDGATIASYEWDFGDSAPNASNSANGQTVDHEYSTANTFVVRLTITDSNDIVGVYTTEVSVD